MRYGVTSVWRGGGGDGCCRDGGDGGEIDDQLRGTAETIGRREGKREMSKKRGI